MASASPTDEQLTTRHLIHRLVRDHVSRYWRGITFAVLCMIITAGATAANAWLMQPVLDDVFVNRNEEMLLLVPSAVLVLAIVNGLATYAQKVAMGRVGLKVVADMQKAMFAHLMRADIAFFQTNATGRLISRFTHDVNLLRRSASDSLTGHGQGTADHAVPDRGHVLSGLAAGDPGVFHLSGRDPAGGAAGTAHAQGFRQHPDSHGRVHRRAG